MLDDRLTRLSYRNFMSFADADMALDDLIVLVGLNGAGKSNFVEGLRFLRDALVGLDVAILNRGGIRQIRRRVSHGGRPPDIEFDVEAMIADMQFSYELTIGAMAGGDWRLKREACSVESGDGRHTFSRDGERVRFDGITSRRPAPEDNLMLPLAGEPFRLLAGFLRRIGAYSIYPNALRRPQPLLRTVRLEDNAQNLASVLRRLRRGRGNQAADQIVSALRDLVPDATNFRVTEPGEYLAVSIAIQRDGADVWFDAARLSDGTLRLLGILTALYQSPPPSVLAVEEPELTVHPGAAATLTDELIDAAHRMQVIVTTHSPDIASRMPIEALRIVEATSEGTKVGMVRHDEVDLINEKLFSPGDLIRIGGLRREIHPTT